MLEIYEFFELVEQCKKMKIEPVLRFKRHKMLSDQPERLNPETSKEDAIV